MNDKDHMMLKSAKYYFSTILKMLMNEKLSFLGHGFQKVRKHMIKYSKS